MKQDGLQQQPQHGGYGQQHHHLYAAEPIGGKEADNPSRSQPFRQIRAEFTDQIAVLMPSQNSQQDHHEKKQPVPFIDNPYRQGAAYDAGYNSFCQHMFCLPTLFQTAKAAFSALKGENRLYKRLFCKIRPAQIGIPEFGVSHLPQQEIADPFASRPALTSDASFCMAWVSSRRPP